MRHTDFYLPHGSVLHARVTVKTPLAVSAAVSAQRTPPTMGIEYVSVCKPPPHGAEHSPSEATASSKVVTCAIHAVEKVKEKSRSILFSGHYGDGLGREEYPTGISGRPRIAPK